MEKFQEIIKNPIYKDFCRHMGKLYSLKEDKGNVDTAIEDLIKYIKNNREQIINFFFVTWLASIEDNELKKEILRSIFMNKVVVIEELFEPSGYKMRISFECKKDFIDE
jgi:hypothetical protein